MTASTASNGVDFVVERAQQGYGYIPASWVRDYCPNDEQFALAFLQAEALGLRIKERDSISHGEWWWITYERVKRSNIRRTLATLGQAPQYPRLP